MTPPANQGPERKFTPDFLTEMFRNPLDPGYAEAAARRAEAGPASPGRRRGGRLARTVILIAAGFLLAVAYHQTVAAQPESSKVHTGLVSDVQSRQAETDAMQHRADALSVQVAKDRDAALAGTDTSALRALEATTGLEKSRGGGAVVRLVDAPTATDPVTNKPSAALNLGVVQDRDLQSVANQLWYDGAEAIAINGERLTATSTIRTAGETILVDFRPITSPYEVSAIGPGDLDKKFTASPAGQLFRDLVAAYRMQVSVRHVSELTLPAASDPQLHYAQPVPPTSPSGSTRSSGSPVPSPSGGR